jgi:hypothetical protein
LTYNAGSGSGCTTWPTFPVTKDTANITSHQKYGQRPPPSATKDPMHSQHHQSPKTLPKPTKNTANGHHN